MNPRKFYVRSSFANPHGQSVGISKDISLFDEIWAWADVVCDDLHVDLAERLEKTVRGVTMGDGSEYLNILVNGVRDGA